MLKNRINKHVNNTCCIIFKSTKYLKNGTVKLFAVCQHSKCKKFRIVIENSTVSVYSTLKDYCHRQKLTSYIKGIERVIVKQKILDKNVNL